MADMLKDGMAWLAGQLKASCSVEVAYTRGYDTVLVQATLGRKLLKLDDGLGNVRMEWTDLDLIIKADDLILPHDSEPLTPERGDVIFVEAPYDTEIYEVAPYGNEPCWRWCDPHQTMVRIHAKRVDVQAP